MKNWFIEKFKKHSTQNDSLEKAEEKRKRYDKYIEYVKENVMSYETTEVANDLIALIVEHLNYKQTIEALEYEHAEMDNSKILELFRYLSSEVGVEPDNIILRKIDPEDEFAYSKSILKNSGEIEIEMNAIPILLNVWKGDRVIDAFQTINGDNKFDGKKYKYNIQNCYLYPMNIIVCSGGNHSQFAARYKNEGQTVVEEIVNYANLYSTITFNGVGFVDRNKKYVELNYSEDEVFYAGILFEMGRYLLDKAYFNRVIPKEMLM